MPEEGEALDIGIGPAPSEAPAEEVSQAPIEAPSDTYNEADPPQDTAPLNDGEDPAAPTDWTTVDFRRASEDDFPEADRATFRHLQDREKALQRDQTARVNDLARRERVAEQREKKLQEAETRSQVDRRINEHLSPPHQTQDSLTIKGLLSRHDLDEDVRETLVLMDREMDQRVAEAIKPFQQIAERFPSIEQSVNTANASAADKRHDTLVDSLDEARTKYPSLDERASEVLRVMGVRLAKGKLVQAGSAMMNYATGEPHNFTTAYELVSGISTKAAEDARDEDERIRDTAQSSVSQVSSTSTGPPRNNMSDTEVRDEVHAIRQRMGTGI